MNNIEIKIVTQAPIDQLITLYKDAGWWNDENDGVDPCFVQKIVAGSFCFSVAILEDRIIGMGRAISDGVSDAYIQDVVVLNKYRGNGIGVLLMDSIIEFLKSKGIGWISLISEPKAIKFYEKYGFTLMKDYLPFKL